MGATGKWQVCARFLGNGMNLLADLSLHPLRHQVIPATAFGLGCWQVYRKQWKEELIRELERKIHMDPVPIPDEYVTGRVSAVIHGACFLSLPPLSYPV